MLSLVRGTEGKGRTRLILAAALALGAALALAPPSRAAVELAQGEKRIALVVGNAAYPEAPLKNPVNDARAMGQSLQARGFEVILRLNATKAQMESAAADFGEKLSEGATGLFFFAGHGIQVQGRNYLIPVDARITSEARVRLETLDVEAVLDQMAAARARVSVVILDACRNNPFERRFRSAGGGLAQINAPEGTLIAYATSPGKVAADGEGANGLYTRELLRAISAPGMKVEDVFKQVRVNVSRASNGSQVPWEASSLTGDFYFAAPAPVAAPAASAQGDRELAFWDAIKASTDPADFRDYLAQYPNGSFASLARRRLATLEAAAPRPGPAPAPAPAAPAARPAPPAIAALPPPAAAGAFEASFPADTVARLPVTLVAELGDGEIWIRSSGATTCFGRGRVETDGSIRPFEVRCATARGGGAGVSQDAARLSGRLASAEGRTVLDLDWRSSSGASGTVRGTPRGGAAPAPAPPSGPMRATFALRFPAGSLARNPVEAELEVDGAAASFSGTGAGATCFGKASVDSGGAIAPFDVRCIGAATGENTQGWSRLSGEVSRQGGAPSLRLVWRNAQQMTGELRSAAR